MDLKKKIFFYIFCYGLNLGPLARAIRPWDIHLNNVVKDHWAMLHTKYQTSEPSGSEEEDPGIYFCAYLWFEPRTPWRRAISDLGTFV